MFVTLSYIKIIQTRRNRGTFERQNSFDDTASEGYSSRKCSDELQYESLSKSFSTNLDPRKESVPIQGSFSNIINSGIPSKQSSIENSITIANVWKTANMKISCVPKDKQSSKQGRSNSDLSILGKSIVKSTMTKRRSQT